MYRVNMVSKHFGGGLLSAVAIISLLVSVSTFHARDAYAQGGILIKGTSFTSIYFLADNGKRYVFSNDKTYLSWYADFSGITIVKDEDLATFQIGGNVTYRPGKKLVKIQTDPKVYAVEKSGVLRWVTTEAIATALYGTNWNQQIDDVPDIFFTNYRIGQPITSTSEYSVSIALSSAPTINEDVAASTSPNPNLPASCTQDVWGCGSWTSCSDSGTQTRSCTIVNECPNVSTPSPALSQSCTPMTSCSADTWECGSWNQCSSSMQSRGCTMTNDCPGVSTASPALTQSCTNPVSCTVDTWNCTNWSACTPGGTQGRVCTLMNDCPTVSTPKPTESQSCTYQPGTLTVGVSSTPVAQSYVMGTQSAQIGGFTFKAGDNSSITITSITLQGQIDDAPSTSYSNGMEAGPNSVASMMTDIKLWNGSIQHGQSKTPASSTGSGTGGSLTFNGLNIIVPASQTITLIITGNIGAGLTTLPDRIRWTIPSANAVVATDSAGVSTTAVAASFPVNGSEQTIQNVGTVTVALSSDDSESEAGLLVGGSSSAVLAKYRFSAANEELKLAKVRLNVASAAAVSSLSLYDGSTLVAGPASVDGSSNADFSNMNFVIPKDGVKVLTVKGNLNSVGSSGAASGSAATVTLTSATVGTFEVRGTTAGSTALITTFAGSPLSGNEKIVRKTKPTVSLVALPSTTLSNGTQTTQRFTISADANGDVYLGGYTINVMNATAAGTVKCDTESSIRRVGDGTNVPGTCNEGTFGTSITNTMSILFGNEERVAAGTSRTYDVKVAAEGITTTGGSLSSYVQSTGFIWSDRSLDGHDTSAPYSGADWFTDGTYLKVLPTEPQTITKS